MKSYPCALTIASSDSSCGAGIQADLKTFSALQCYGLSIIVALTAQNTLGVQAIQPQPLPFIEAQFASIFDDMGCASAKIGMLFNRDIILCVKSQLQKYRVKPLITDPVMVATSGHLLLEKNAMTALKEEIFPLTTLVTPNTSEAEVLLERKIENHKDMEEAAKDMADLGPHAALIKGGHLSGADASDCLYIASGPDKGIYWLVSPRYSTPHTHGTGCTLSSAICAFLARGYALKDATYKAKTYIEKAIKAGSQFTLGKGRGPVHHYHEWWS